MKLSEAIDRLTGIAMENIPDPDRRDLLQFIRGIIHGAITHFGDIEMNIEIRRVPTGREEVHAETSQG